MAVWIWAVVAAASAACDALDDSEEGVAAESEGEGDECSRCHTGPDDPPPFRPLFNATDDEVILDRRRPLDALGAHTKHIGGSSILDRLACGDCHHVPTSVYGDPRHLPDDNRAEVDFTLATFLGLPEASYDPQTRTCTLYCHSTSDTGTSPPWNAAPTSGEATCHLCHEEQFGDGERTKRGIPRHPERSDCQSCHTETAALDEKGHQTIGDRSKHLNRVLDLDVSKVTCNDCHDFTTLPDESDPAFRIKRFHFKHAAEGRTDRITNPATCETCHEDFVPTLEDFLGIKTHNDGYADVSVDFDPQEERCSQNACHDHGGSNPAPRLTDGPQDCGSCHGAPPERTTPPVHVADAGCHQCHSTTTGLVDGEETIVNPSTHIDGILQVDEDLECATCHEPLRSEESRPHHQRHADLGYMCFDCHEGHGEGGSEEPEHPDGTRQVSFSELAAFLDLPTTFTEEDDGGCLVYCHDGSEGGTISDASWRASTTYVSSDCNGCHGVPPTLNDHPQVANCPQCHSSTELDVSGRPVLTDRSQHIDHERDARTDLSCATATCHDELRATRPLSVAHHAAHAVGGSTQAPVECEACHEVPANVDDTGHLDDLDRRAEIVFSGRGTGMSYDAAEKRCDAESSCHHVEGSPGTRAQWSWDDAPLTGETCDTCHIAEPEEQHQASEDCSPCHPTMGPARTIVDRDQHGNRVVDVITGAAALCVRCHDVTSADDNHAGHVADPLLTPEAYACSECHGTSASLSTANIFAPTHRDDEIQFSFGAIARADGRTSSVTGDPPQCFDVACHDRGGRVPEPVWGSGSSTRSCGACHPVPPTTPPHQLTDGFASCQICHDTDMPSDSRNHVNGVVNVRSHDVLCTSCHDLPPLDVGQHAGVFHAGQPCTTCHPAVPESMTDHSPRGDGVSLAFSGLAAINGATPTFNSSTAMCSGVYCHGATLPGGVRTEPQWTDESGMISANCDSCHGNPPPDSAHELWFLLPDMFTCGDCHPLTEDTHVNGTVDAGGTP